MKIGYYEVLEELERLSTNNISKITVKDVANNIGVTERCTRRAFEKLVKEDLIKRTIIYDKSNKRVYYCLNNNKTEGFINGVFKTITDLIHR